MSSTGPLSIILNLPYDGAFNMLGSNLAEHIGASPLLYAALAYFVFDESFFLEDLSDNYPELEEDLMWWLEDFYSSHYRMIEDLRIFYETHLQTGPSPRRAFPPYKLLTVLYLTDDESVFIGASQYESDSRYGSEWRLPHQRGDCDGGYGDELRRTFRISGRSGNCAAERLCDAVGHGQREDS